MKNYIILVLYIIVASFCGQAHSDVFQTAKSWFDFASGSASDIYCGLRECCNDKNVPYKPGNLKYMLKSRLFGQHIASDVVLNALSSHFKNLNPRKPLVMSFHGANGVGKSYVSKMIAKTFYELGENSRFFHFYYGLENFPLVEKISEYQTQLKYELESAIKSCEKSLFVFDGVDQMHPGLLNVLMPFIDCPNCGKVRKNKSVFIFLTNAGSLAIEKELIKKKKEGISREATTLQDFEKIVVRETFNRTGGLFESLMIKADAIDFYVPFLPLEREHVENCIIEAFEEQGDRIAITKEMVDQVFQELLFGPEPEKLFSISGCKRVAVIAGRILSKSITEHNFFDSEDEKSNYEEL